MDDAIQPQLTTLNDRRDILPTIEDDTYELVLAIDILEHLEKQDGLRFIEQLRRVSSKYVLVSTPKVVHRQVVFANPYENHRSPAALSPRQCGVKNRVAGRRFLG